MAIETLSINQGTQTPVAFDSIGGTAYIQQVKLNTGADGVDSLWDGKVAVSAATITSGSVVITTGTIASLPNIPGGTLNLVTRVGNVGTLEVGTINTLPNLPGGSIVVTAGTIGSMPNTPGGTLGLITRVGNVGTLEVGTINTLPNIPGGTIGVVTSLSGGTITRLEGGTVGLISTVTTVSNITNGSIVMTAGTIGSLPNVTLAGGTVQNLNGGTITSVQGGTIGLVTRVGNIGTLEVGTISTLPNIPGGTLGLVTTVTNLSNGTIQSSGTTTGVGVVSLLSAGTITKLEGGTVSTNMLSGTLNLGTVNVSTGTINSISNIAGGTIKNDGRPGRNVLTYGTVYANASAAFATLVGSAVVGVGTSIWINDLSIVNSGSASADISVQFNTGTTGSNVIARGNFGANGGIQKSFPLAVNGGSTNTDLTVWLSGGTAGTTSVNVTYFISA